MEHLREKGSSGIEKEFAKKDLTANEEGAFHGSWLFEQMLFALIRDGESKKLRAFLEETDKIKPYNEGVLASDPLRQAKNLFIGLVAVVGKTAAVPGGLDVEETYRLIDLYTQECEKTTTVNAVRSLQYNMLFDFAERVALSKLPENLTKEIAQAMDHIQNNTYISLSVDDVAEHIGKSRAWLTREFRRETSLTVNQYIIRCKVNDAKRLLRYSDLTLSQISSYLGFSSQPYFQTVFKKETGVTPLEYRNWIEE